MGDRADWTTGALVGSLVAGVAISGLMLGKERLSGEPSDLIRWERRGAGRFGLRPNGRPGAAEQVGVHGGHLTLSALGGAAYAVAFNEDAPVVASGLAFGAAFYFACHWIAGPLLRLKPPEWRESPAAVAQHVVVHALYGVLTALGARLGSRRSRV